MTFRGRGLARGALLASAALILAACGGDDAGDSEATAGASGGTYSVGSEATDYMTPSNCYNLYCQQILNGVFTGLYTFETEGTSMVTAPTPLLKSVSTADNGKTYTIEINPGSTFTNGEAVTAQTFVDTWNFAANGGNGQQLGFVFGESQLNVAGYDKVSGAKSKDGKMSGLKATSPTTIEMTLVAPIGQSLFENYVAGPQILPLPSVAFEDPVAYEKMPIGNGPYMFKDPWASTTGATIVRNPDYAYTPGKADQIDFRFYSDTAALWADLQGDNVDVTTSLPQSALATADAVLGDRYINVPGMLFSYEAYPTQVDTFKNRDVRVALAKAVNWEEINQKLYFGTRVVAKSFGPPAVPGGGQDVCGDDCTYDPAAAKALLDNAGGLPGNKIFLGGTANSENLALKAECNMLQTNLGIECEVKLYPTFGALQTAFQNLSADDAGLLISGIAWQSDNPALANNFGPLFATGAGTNYGKTSIPEFDKLIAEGNQAADEAAAISKWQEAEKVLFQEFPGHATQWRNQVGGYSNKVSNVKVNSAGFINIAEITVNSAG